MTGPTPNNMPGATTPPAAAAAPGAPAPSPVEAAAAAATGATAPGAPAAAADAGASADTRPPWEKSGEPFDESRAWTHIQNLQKDLADYKDLRGELRNTRKAEAALEEYKAEVAPIIEERERLRRASQTDLDRANEDLGTMTTERDDWRTQAIQAKAEALAASRNFVDTETALALMGDVSQFAKGNSIDVEGLTARLDELAADKPFLVAAPAQPPGFTPNRAQGQSGTGQVPLDAQIQAAQARGDHLSSIALKQQRYHQQAR